MSFYCQKACGEVGFSIDEWNDVYKSVQSLPEKEQQQILHPKGCAKQCFDCMAIVGERQAKTKSKILTP